MFERRSRVIALLWVAVAVSGCGSATTTQQPLINSAAAPEVSDSPDAPVTPDATQLASSPDGASMPALGSMFPATPVPSASGLFPGGLLIADRGNDRLLVVNDAGAILWRFPTATSLRPGETFAADDAFVAPDGKSIVANEESNQIVVRIDIATEAIVWEYGTYGVKGDAAGQLSTPDDAYPLPNGDVSIADIRNCRILAVSPAGSIDSQIGQSGVCAHNPPTTLDQPNGDTPLPDGGMLITEIVGSRVLRLSPTGQVIFDISVPAHYPSDAHLLPNGNVLVADYSNPGAVLVVDPSTGAVVYRYAPTSGPGRLDRPSLALTLPNGMYVVNDDFNQRVVVIDPSSSSIVWSYGHTGQASSADGYLNIPDGVDVAQPGTFQ